MIVSRFVTRRVKELAYSWQVASHAVRPIEMVPAFGRNRVRPTEPGSGYRQYLPVFVAIFTPATIHFSTITAFADIFASLVKYTYGPQVESDMTVKPYESEGDREARRKAEEEKRRREEEAKGSNDKFRALDVSRCQARDEGR